MSSTNETYHLTGTSGYSYEHWMSKQFKQNFHCFYPPNVSKDQMFNHYVKHFDFLEINTTFYGNPSEDTVKKWYASTPSNFRFLVKANKYITHSKKMLDFTETYVNALTLVSHLKEKCLGILLQLPPTFKNDPRNFERIRAAGLFQKSYANPYKYQIFIEFRHPSWFQESVYKMLKEIGWSLTIVNINNMSGAYGEMCHQGIQGDSMKGFFPTIEEVISGQAITVPGTIMFRCHGTFDSRAYMGDYSDIDLMTMASIASSVPKGLVVFNTTDSYQHQLDTPWFSSETGNTYKLVFDSNAIEQMDTPLSGTKVLLPHAIQDALKIKGLFN
jgi:uncharacterized protein YecE (DUF72 family)